MPSIEQERVDSAPAVAVRSEGIDPVQDLFRDWGLTPGRVVMGWTVDAVGRGEQQNVAFATFARGAASIRVTFRRAGAEPRFARVGEIDIAHEKVDADLNPVVGSLLKIIVAWLKQHGAGADLVPLLASAPVSTDAATPPTKPMSSLAPEAERPIGDRTDAGYSADPRSGNGATASQPYVVVHEAPPLDPAKKAPADRPVLGFEFIDVADLHKYPDALPGWLPWLYLRRAIGGVAKKLRSSRSHL